MSSRSGNRTPGASVTGSNVTNYTNRDRALSKEFVQKYEPSTGFEPVTSRLLSECSAN